MARTKKTEEKKHQVKKIAPPAPAKKKGAKTKEEKVTVKPAVTEARAFGEADQIVLSQNEFFRFAPNPEKVAHAVIRASKKAGKVTLTATQYKAPIQKDSDRTIDVPSEMAAPPLIRPLIDIQKIDRFGQTRFRAKTPDTGTQMFATRSERLEIDGEEATLAFFSPLPPKSKGNEPFWGSEKKLEFFKDTVSPAAKKACLSSGECSTLDDSVHKMQETEVDYPSVHARDGEKRSISQNQVMGNQSARDAVEAFHHEHEDVMHPDLAKVMQSSHEAPLRDAWNSQKRPEWLHISAHSLMPESEDPQMPENLGAAPKWTNSRMMVPERTVKWYAFNRPDSEAKLEGDFTMLHGTDIAADIQFDVTLTEGDKTIKMQQHLNPWAPYPIYSTGSDIAQSVLVAHSIHQEADADVQTISEEEKKAAKSSPKESLLQTVFAKKAQAAYLQGPTKKAWQSSLPEAQLDSFVDGRFHIPESVDPENYLTESAPGIFSHFPADRRAKKSAFKHTLEAETPAEPRRRVVISSRALHGHSQPERNITCSSLGRSYRTKPF